MCCASPAGGDTFGRLFGGAPAAPAPPAKPAAPAGATLYMSTKPAAPAGATPAGATLYMSLRTLCACMPRAFVAAILFVSADICNEMARE
jgi:hypothetical protein